jgi:small-conductance mechanosensitive channel
MSPNDVLRIELIRLHDVPVTIGAVLMAALILAAGWGLSVTMQRAARRRWDQHATGEHRNVHGMLRLGHYVVMLVAFGVALETVGINLTALFAAGAIFAVGVVSPCRISRRTSFPA